MAYQLVEDFRGGLDTRRLDVTAPAGTLRELRNAHIDRGAEIAQRKAIVSTYTLPTGSTEGLAALNGDLYVFGHLSAGSVSVPSGITYQRLVNAADANQAIAYILDWTVLADKLYVVAEFADGNVYHYYDGVRVTEWDGIAVTLSSNDTVAEALRTKIDAHEDYTASRSGSVVTITAATAGVPFTITSATVDRGGTDDQTLAPATTTPNVTAVSEVLASTTFRVTGGTSNPGTNRVTAVYVDGVEILGSAVNWTTSHSATATAVAAQITSNTSSPNYTATASGPEVTIRAATGTGAGPNGFLASVSVGGDVTATAPAALSGGVTAATAVAQVSTLTVAGTFQAADVFSAYLNGEEFTVTGAASGTGRNCMVLDKHVYSTVGPYLYRSAIANPLQWTTGVGSGFIDMSLEARGAGETVGLGIYGSRLAVFTKEAILLWAMDPELASSRKSQTIRAQGPVSSNAIVELDDGSLAFVTRAGIRALRVRDSSGDGAVADMGLPIDKRAQPVLAALTAAQLSNLKCAVEPADKLLWIVAGQRVFVFTRYPEAKITAWSEYWLDISITDMVAVDNAFYVRAGDVVYRYGGSDGQTHDSAVVRVETAFLDASKPAHFKDYTAIDLACEGLWIVSVAMNPEDPDEWEEVARVPGTTYARASLGVSGRSTHIRVRAVSSGAGPHKLGNLCVHYDLLDPS